MSHTPVSPPPSPAAEVEAARLRALARADILDTLPEQAFDDITALASQICGTPIALISMVDAQRQWFKSRVGLAVAQTGRDVAFCAHAILQPDELMVVPDTLLDARFVDNPLVTGEPSIRFYAGAPIVTRDGHALGTLCAIDRQPRQLDAGQLASLRLLARQVSRLIDQREHTLRVAADGAQALEANRNRMELLLAVTMQGLDLKAFVDPGYVYRYVNQTYLDYWQRQREDIEGRSVAQLMGEEMFTQRIKPLLDRALAGESITYEASFDFPQRGPRFTQVNYLPARSPTGQVIGVVVRVQDIQPMKDKQAQLSQSLAALEEKTLAQQGFIHILSHDLREPLNTIINFSSLLTDPQGGERPAETAQRYLGFIHQGGERMRTLLDDLLGYVRLESTPLQRVVFNLGSVMDEVAADLADAAARRRAQLIWAELPEVWAERSLLRVMLQNLVSNALKFARAGVAPRIEVTAQAQQGQWRIAVTDNGIGIPPDQCDRIFDLFGRLHSRKEFEGTGMGLATCRRIAELHGGSIKVHPATPGPGSCFCIVLPQAPMAVKESA